MAEVKLSVPGNKYTLTYTDDIAHIYASIAPPSMTFVDQHPQVTIAKDSIFIMTYTDNNEVIVEGNLQRDVISEIEVTSDLVRNVTNSLPFNYELEGDIRRVISNDIELEGDMKRNVISYNVSQSYELRRIVSNSIELECNTKRNIIAKIELCGNTERTVLNPDIEIDIPSKEYKSFISKDKLFRVQHDVLDEDVSDNPYFEKQISNIKNSALLTNNQTIIKAINELFVNQHTIFETAYNSFRKIGVQIGDVVSDEDLKEQYSSLEVNNIIEGLIKLSNTIDILSDFIGITNIELKNEIEAKGYSSLLDGLNKLSEELKDIIYSMQDCTIEEIQQIFDSTIPESAKDPYFELFDSMRTEINEFEEKIETKYLEDKREIEEKIAEYINIISEYDNITEEDIARIFLDNSISESNGGLSSHQLEDRLNSIETSLLAIQNSLNDIRSHYESLDTRLNALENSFSNNED